MKTRITELFGIKYPIIQAGMVWASGARLTAAAANAGALGLIGAGSMKAELLREHIRKCRTMTTRRFGVNLPLIRDDINELAAVIIDEGIDIVFTSAGNPAKFVEMFKSHDCMMIHVIASVKHARKAQEAGCDAVVAEGFEAGGHNGIDEITTLCLVPQVADAITIPVIAAGGIADGRGMLAAMALGADAVQVGTRFAVTVESSAHENYKRAVLEADDAATVMALKKVSPVRMIKNKFAAEAVDADRRGASREEQVALLGRKREQRGIFEGDVDEGEIEAGQSCGLVKDLITAREVVDRMMREYEDARTRVNSL